MVSPTIHVKVIYSFEILKDLTGKFIRVPNGVFVLEQRFVGSRDSTAHARDVHDGDSEFCRARALQFNGWPDESFYLIVRETVKPFNLLACRCGCVEWGANPGF